MTRQYPEDVEVQRIARVPRTGAWYVVARYAEQRTDGGVLVVAPLIRSQRGRSVMSVPPSRPCSSASAWICSR